MSAIEALLRYYIQVLIMLSCEGRIMRCRKHTKEVPMVDVTIDFIGHKVVVGHYCLLCYNFVNKANPEVQMLRNLLIKNMSETSRQF